MFNRIKESKFTKLTCGLMLVSMVLSFSGGILGPAQDLVKSKPIKTVNKVLSKSPDNRRREETVASQTTMKQASLEQSQTESNAQNKFAAPIEATTWKPAVNNVKPTTAKSNSNIDINLLARVIYAESRGEPFVGQVGVGAVLLNRLEDSRFPKNLSQIIFTQGEFCTVRDGQIWKTPNQQALQAARLAVAGWDPTGGAIYFYNPAKTTSHWIWSRPIVNKIGNHIFAL